MHYFYEQMLEDLNKTLGPIGFNFQIRGSLVSASFTISRVANLDFDLVTEPDNREIIWFGELIGKLMNDIGDDVFATTDKLEKIMVEMGSND